MQKSISGLSDAYDIVQALKNIVKNDTVFSEYAQAASMKMVTQLFTDSGRTWRQAARENSRGRTIYEALRHELTGVIRGEYYSQINRNAGIIKTLPYDIAKQVTNYVEQEATKGRRASEIANEIQTMFPEKSKAKANLIARTEVSKTSTALTRARSEDIGLAWYAWESSQDERVRRSHKHMQGVLVSWREPPSPEKLVGEKSVGNYDAGCIFNCRCYPATLIDIDDVKWPHKVYYNGKIQTMTRKQFEQIM